MDKDPKARRAFSVIMKGLAVVVAILVGWGAYQTAVEATTTINWGMRLARAEKFMSFDPSWQRVSLVEHPAQIFCESMGCPPKAEIVYKSTNPVTTEQMDSLLRSTIFPVKGDCQHGDPTSLCTLHGTVNTNFTMDATVTHTTDGYLITIDLAALR